MDKYQLTVNPIRTLSYGLSVFFFQIFLSSLNNLQSGFSFSITFILVVITVAEDFECLIFFLWRAELWEFNWVGNDTDCMLRHIRNSQLANCFCIRSVVSPSVWFFVKSNSIQSLLCTDVIGLPQGWPPGQPEGFYSGWNKDDNLPQGWVNLT